MRGFWTCPASLLPVPEEWPYCPACGSKPRFRPKTCPDCGRRFTPSSSTQKRCSWCGQLHDRARHFERDRRLRERRRLRMEQDLSRLPDRDPAFLYYHTVNTGGQPGTDGTPLMNLKVWGWNGQARIAAAVYLKQMAPQLPIAPV